MDTTQLPELALVAEWYDRQGDIDNSESYLREALELASAINPDSKHCAATLLSLVSVLDKTGRASAAKQSLQRAVGVLTKTFPTSQECSEAVTRLRAVYSSDAAFTEAFDSSYLHRLKSLKAKGAFMGELERIALSLQRKRNYRQAAALYKEGLVYCRSEEQFVVVRTEVADHSAALVFKSLTDQLQVEQQLTVFNLFNWLATLYKKQRTLGAVEHAEVKKLAWGPVHDLHFQHTLSRIRASYD